MSASVANYLHVPSQIVEQLAKTGPVGSAKGVGDGREIVGTVTGDFGVDSLSSHWVTHAEIVFEKDLRNTGLTR